MSKCGAFSGTYFSVFGLISSNTGKCRPEKSPYLDNFHAVFVLVLIRVVPLKWPFHVILVTYNKKSTGFAAEQMYIPISDILITLKSRTRNQANTAAMSMYSFCLNSIHFTIIVCIESRKRI